MVLIDPEICINYSRDGEGNCYRNTVIDFGYFVWPFCAVSVKIIDPLLPGEKNRLKKN